MKNQAVTSINFQSINNEATVKSFLQQRGVQVSTEKDTVKSFFEGNDFHLAIYDAKQGKNTMLLTVNNFVANEDLLIEINQVFRTETQHLSTYHILKFARQATDEVIGLLPTFQAFFGERKISTPAVNVNFRNKFVPQNTHIAA